MILPNDFLAPRAQLALHRQAALCQAWRVSAPPDNVHIELGPGLLGIITDIHANPYALEAALGDGSQKGVDRWLVLGDVVAMGPEPGRVMDQLAQLDVVAFVSGNTERYVLTGERPGPTLDEVAADSHLLPRLVELAGTFAWTKGYLQAQGSLDLLREFLPNVHLRFPDGTGALAVHASLIADDGLGISPSLDEVAIAVLFPDLDADIVFGGHTHRATDLTFDGIRFVNPGSISNHDEPHLGARYTTVRLGANDHTVEHHEVQYDKRLATDAIKSSGIPGQGFLLSRYFGEDGK